MIACVGLKDPVVDQRMTNVRIAQPSNWLVHDEAVQCPLEKGCEGAAKHESNGGPE
jgi:hypothetical protein